MQIAARDGLQSMTLDNLARQAGVSKGGVMHHFPTKDRLIEAVVAHFGERLEQTVLELVANDPQPRLRWARAFVDCTFPHPAARRTSSRPRAGSRPATAPPGEASRRAALDPVLIDQFFLAVLSAAATRPTIILPLRELGRRIQRRLLSDPADGLDQLLIWLALDGLLLWQYAGLLDRDDPLFQRVGRELRRRLAASDQPGVSHGLGKPLRQSRSKSAASKPARGTPR
ncbi:MAG: TetR/AcrR family transcriptional regulator [Planctomycetaceae bacterium]